MNEKTITLSAAIKRLGGPKSVALRLWPGKDAQRGAHHLNCCLNSERRERLPAKEVSIILKWAGE